MEVPVNYLAVLVAAASSIVLGFLWYGPLFGKVWMAQMGITKESMSSVKQGEMMKSYVLMTIGSLLMAYVLSHSLTFASTYTQTTGYLAGVMVAFWTWLGFVAPVTLSSVLWEKKSWKLWCINAGYYLVSLKIMGVILALWK